MPQWKKVYFSESANACLLPGGAMGEETAKWDNGSAAPKKISPIPIPAENSIESQDSFVYSGLESGSPRRIWLAGLHMIKTQKATIAPTKSK